MVAVLQHVKLSHTFPQAIWHAVVSGRRLLIDTPEDDTASPVAVVVAAGARFAVTFSTCLRSTSAGAAAPVVVAVAATAVEDVEGVASSGCKVAEWMP